MWLGTVVGFDSIYEGMGSCKTGPMLALRMALNLLGQHSVVEWEWLEGGHAAKWLNPLTQPADERQALVWHLLMLQDTKSSGRNTVHERGLHKLDVQTSLQWRASPGKAKDLQGAGRAVQFGDVLTAARTVWWGTGRSKACSCGAPVADAFHRHHQCPRWQKHRESFRERGQWDWLEGHGLAHFTDRELQWRHKAWSKSFSHIADPVDQIDLVFTDGTATNPTRP